MAEFIRQIRSLRPDLQRFLLFTLFANVGLGVFMLIFNLYLTALGLREDDIGLLTAAQTLSMAAAAASMGSVLGRFGLWRTILVGTALFAIAAVGSALSESLMLLVPLMVAFGIGFSLMITTTMPFVIEWTRPDQRQQASALAFSTAAISTTAGSLIGGLVPARLPLDDVGQYRITLIIGMAITAIGFLPLFAMKGARRQRTTAESADAKSSAPDDRRQVRRDMAIFIAIGGLMAIGAGLVGPFFNVYLQSLGGSSTQIGIVFALAGLSSALVGLSAPAVSRRFGSLWAVVVVRSAVVPIFLALLFAPSYLMAVLAWIVRQTSISMAWPIDSTFIAEVLPPRSRSAVYGLRSAAWNVGFSVSSLVGGVLIVQYGYALNFIGLIVFTALAMAVFGGYYATHPRIRSGEIAMALSPRARARIERLRAEEVAAALGEAPGALGEAISTDPAAPLAGDTEQTAPPAASSDGLERADPATANAVRAPDKRPPA